MKFIVAALVLLAAGIALPAHSQTTQPQASGPSQEYNGELAQRRSTELPSTDRIIIKWRGADAKAGPAARAQKAAGAGGMTLQRQQALTSDIDVMQMQRKLSGAALDELIERLEADPAVEYASPDLRRHAHALTSDPLLTDQWYLLGDQLAATRTHLAWDVTMGSAATIVAVLDTGVRFEHPDLGRVETGGKLLPGYDFVSNTLVANDGNGRDGDPADPGDWLDSTDRQNPTFVNCGLAGSSWHGTRVSSLIGALTNNAAGVAGAAWNTLVLPVRVLGKCGGFDADIIAGMRWAAGLSVDGVPDNPTPAKVINLSLGGTGLCSTAYQAAVNEVLARGVLVVVSAGNEGGPVAAPANCSGVLGVAGLRHVGTKVGFSNLGTQVSIGAPGGNCVNTGAGQPCLFSIVAATNTGATIPVDSTFTDQSNFNVGTSFSAPLVSAAAALMHSVNTALTPPQFIKLLKQSASTYPTSSSTSIQNCHVPVSTFDVQASECTCTTQTCGAGMLNTNAAVNAAQRPLAVVSTTGTVTPGTSIALNGSTSFASNGRNVVSFQWSIMDVTAGPTPTIVSPTQSTTTLQIAGEGSFTLRLTVADDLGAQDTEDVILGTPTPPVTAPPSGTQVGGGGGAGGAFGWELIGLALLACLRRVGPRRLGPTYAPANSSRR